MIACLHAGQLPAIARPPDTTLSAGSSTLTQVVTAAIYGAPLNPGGAVGSLRVACEPLQLEGRALWKCPNGPGWLRQHLEMIADGTSLPVILGTMDDSERITMGWFAAAQRWLIKTRKQGLAHGLPPELAEKVIRLAGMSDAEAIAHALAEADRIERAERIVNAKAANFYELLSDAIANDRITLKAIATNPQTDIWLTRTRGEEPPHQSIATDYFEMQMVHDLFDNELEADRFSDEAKSLDSIFNRIERENEGRLVKWSDVKVRSEDVNWLLSTFRDDWKATDYRPLSGATHQPIRSSSRRGARPKMQYTALRVEALRLMDHHGEFSDDDPDWNGPEKLIAALQDFHSSKFNREPGRSTLQPHVAKWVEEYRRKSTCR